MMQSSHQITQAQSGMERFALSLLFREQPCICATVQLASTAEKHFEKWTCKSKGKL